MLAHPINGWKHPIYHVLSTEVFYVGVFVTQEYEKLDIGAQDTLNAVNR